MSTKKQLISVRTKFAITSAFIVVASLVLPSSNFLNRMVERTVLADTGSGAVSLTTLGTPVTENFDTLSNTAGSTTNTTLPTGWYITEQGGGARDNEQYAVDTGASTTGDIYSYGAAASTDRALGALRSGTLIPFYGAKFTNNTGATITSLDVSYIGEEWRCGTAGRTDRIDFQISTNATDLTTSPRVAVPHHEELKVSQFDCTAAGGRKLLGRLARTSFNNFVTPSFPAESETPRRNGGAH